MNGYEYNSYSSEDAGVLNEGAVGRRYLSTDEKELIRDRYSRWLPKLIVSRRTPLTETISSPDKAGALVVLGMALKGAVGGGALGYLRDKPVKGALTGLTLGAVTSIPIGYITRYAKSKKNRDTIEAIRKLPAGATVGDMKKTKLYHTDKEYILNILNDHLQSVV